jgi:hypothetical protein
MEEEQIRLASLETLRSPGAPRPGSLQATRLVFSLSSSKQPTK